MDPAAEFDALYKDVRDRLLVEAYALTGDLGVSRTAVRDAFAVAWHHWHNVQRVQDKVGWLRPHVWRRARNRHQARPWHRERHLAEGVSRTLEALNGLSLNQRKALVLTHLSPVAPAEAAREIGVTTTAAQTLLSSATTEFASARGCEVDAVGGCLEELRTAATGRWPRSSIVRRAGTARRRTHAVGGVLATLALVVASGTLVAQGSDDDAALSDQGFSRRPVKVDTAPPVPVLASEVLLESGQVERVDRGLQWRTVDTHDNTTGNGLVLPCQRASFADPDGLGAYVRTFEGTPAKRRGKAGPATAVQMVELSRTADEAKEAYRTALGWFTGCSAPRTQLMGVHALPSVGDQAGVVTLRTWRGARRTVQVAVARTGQLTTTTVSDTPGWRPSPVPAASLLGASVNALCGTQGADSCAAPPRPKAKQVPVAGIVPGMLSEFDLPPMDTKEPWAGTAPKKAVENRAATRCDNTSFTAKNIKHDLTRTFLFPKAAKRNPSFGLTQTVGMTRNARQARRFVERVRTKIARCAEDDPGTEVTRLVDRRSKRTEVTAWGLDIDLPDDRNLQFLMVISRHGRSVSQVGFVPAGRLQMSRQDFTALAERAQERLPRLRLGAQTSD
ncbi:hypothetical protein IEQ44_09465 [Nocardioides sp. Y6]|uniref:RNA polymerase sigma factor 70 region 4 type 2 domain-containing protein n=1 Tax=Nocardioides malaquae TaxID=2773426 RepID=A0ABR9RTI6_9ACTN|nr:sigma-70 family RNA polymerase sigma factor [Nocardioides malaquae]MBE7324883.1 hypothetical protein [Nocardioides malaquae]